MVGFVGESEEEFSQSLQFAEKMAFAKIHVFPYSIRMGTVAAMYTDQVVPQIKSARVKRMTEIGKRLEREFLQQHVGMTVPVLIEKQHSPNYSNGFTPEYIPVRIYGESLERCNTVNVKITAALDDHVAGSLI